MTTASMISGLAGGRITVSAGANMLGQHAQERNPEATLYVGNLDAQMDEYFLKSGDEKLVAAKLNEDLDSYWKNKPAEMEE